MTEEYKPFVSPKLKVARAKQHLDHLARCLESFEHTNPFNFYIYTYPDDYPDWHFGMVGYIPPDVSLAYGDAVHCLRSSLDLLAGDIVRLNGQPADGVYFPFAKDKDGLKEQIKNKKFHRASLSAQDLLKKTMPYWGGNGALRGLHELDIQDKHQLILPVYPVIVVERMYIRFGRSDKIDVVNSRFPVDTYIKLGAGVPSKVEFPGKLRIETFFSLESPEPFHQKPLLETLHSLAEMVSGIIESFELLLTGAVGQIPQLRPSLPEPPFGPRPEVFIRDHDGVQWLLRDVQQAK